MLTMHPAEVWTAVHCRGLSVPDLARRQKVPPASVYHALEKYAPEAKRLDDISARLGVRRMAYAPGDVMVAEARLLQALPAAEARRESTMRIEQQIAARSRKLGREPKGRKCNHRKVLADLDSGLSLAEIGRRHGVERQAIYKIRRNYRGEQPSRKTSQRVRDAWELLDSGMSISAVARELKVSREAVWQAQQRRRAAGTAARRNDTG
jgi:lambda repressor-like predicted transcriptional regulator